jgi:hypothetical protein
MKLGLAYFCLGRLKFSDGLLNCGQSSRQMKQKDSFLLTACDTWEIMTRPAVDGHLSRLAKHLGEKALNVCSTFVRKGKKLKEKKGKVKPRCRMSESCHYNKTEKKHIGAIYRQNRLSNAENDTGVYGDVTRVTT